MLVLVACVGWVGLGVFGCDGLVVLVVVLVWVPMGGFGWV